MGFLHKLWDETLAGPAPDSGLGKLRKYDSFSASTTRSAPAVVPHQEMAITRSITILRTHSNFKNLSVDPGSAPDSPATPTTPGTPLSRMCYILLFFSILFLINFPFKNTRVLFILIDLERFNCLFICLSMKNDELWWYFKHHKLNEKMELYIFLWFLTNQKHLLSFEIVIIACSWDTKRGIQETDEEKIVCWCTISCWAQKYDSLRLVLISPFNFFFIETIMSQRNKYEND